MAFDDDWPDEIAHSWILSPARLPIPPRRRFGKERDDTASAHKLKRAEHVETLTGW